MKQISFVILFILLACTHLQADLSSVYMSQGMGKLKAGDFLNAKFLFRKAIRMNPDNSKAWEYYDESVIKLDALEKNTRNLVLVPKFDIKYDEIKITDIKNFKQKYIKIAGRIKNLSDLSFKKLIVRLQLKRGETKVKTLSYLIENLNSGAQRTFSFNKLVPSFTAYEIETKVIEED